MVFFFVSNIKDEKGVPYKYYMGRDKTENEDLIKYGWPEDFWFHVDKLSSAHVYVRQSADKTVYDIPESVVRECSQLVKENSIEGHKKDCVDVVYTGWSNLKKTGDMVEGQVGFHSPSQVIKVKNVEKNRDLIRYMQKGKTEIEMSEFISLREERDKLIRDKQRLLKQTEEEQKKRDIEEQKRQKELKSYAALNDSEKMKSNKDDGYTSDDFM
ncbi:coiled-coil domain-containing protein 25-like [Symsagittifera roscoffensis]|uniref:coiled-coil domain-containing protein 25-like n=1 Tax=Symsagittifera roscoffensis TaxID=84072 RepID=UPI00307BCDF8